MADAITIAVAITAVISALSAAAYFQHGH